MFTVAKDNIGILSSYPCGGHGSKVDVNFHGVTWAVWKLIDDYERHISGSSSVKPCKICAAVPIDINKFVSGFLELSYAAERASMQIVLMSDQISESVA